MKHVALITIQKSDFYIKSDCMNHTGNNYVVLTIILLRKAVRFYEQAVSMCGQTHIIVAWYL